MANAGRVAIVPKGEYNSATAYKRLDLVRYNNAVYVAKKANTGVSPTNADTWMLCIQNVTQEQYDDLISGAVQVESAKEADNALLLENLTAEQVGESGARNLIPYPYYETTHTENGIAWTDNGDGSVTANGLPTSNTYFRLTKAGQSTADMRLDKGIYTLSDATGYVSKSTWLMVIKNDSVLGTRQDKAGTSLTSHKVTFEVTEEESKNCTFEVYIGISNIHNEIIENVTFKPMLERGSIAHDFVSYHFGGAEDSQKLNGLTAEEFVNNENLLVNPYGVDPVNSKGATTYTQGKMIDGWIIQSANITATLESDGILFENSGSTDGYVYSKISNLDKLVGEKIVLSMMLNSTIYYSESAEMALTTNALCRITFDGGSAYIDAANLQITIKVSANSSFNLQWAKLELGSVATPFIPPNKEVEKLKCGGFTRFNPNKIVGADALLSEFENLANLTTIVGNCASVTISELGLSNASGTYIMQKDNAPYGTLTVIINGIIGTNYYNNGVWQGWKNIADGGNADTLDGLHASDFLPATGTAAKATADANGKNIASTYKTKAESVNVKISTTAPSDTSAVWVDTANKVTKIYKDGAWTALA